MKYWNLRIGAAAVGVSLCVACGGNNGSSDGTNNGTSGTNNGTVEGTNNGTAGANNGAADLDGYAFASRYDGSASSVSYSGQIARHVLISDLTSWIGSLSERIDSNAFQPGDEGSVVDELEFYYLFDSSAYGDEAIGVSTTPPAEQSTYAAVSTDKNLAGKLAGNDAATDHRDWSAEFAGWEGASSPEALLYSWFETLEDAAIDHADGVERTSPGGEPIPVHVTPEGRDLKQLTQKFLLGALAFSQGADDYLDDSTEGKGLLSPNTRDGDAMYTTLEHHWDEGFGYFGAARNYADYTDEEIAGKDGREGWSGGYHDTDGDGSIDLVSEYNWGASTNAAKRDLGSASGTDFTAEIFGAFVAGRQIIADAPEGETLDAATLDALRAQRDIAVLGWEKALAATVVHYINDTIAAGEALGSDDYDFEGHAKVWSEMKGFALAFQFNPNSPMLDDFAELHRLMGIAPVLEADDVVNYNEDLLGARDLLQAAYGFEQADVEGW